MIRRIILALITPFLIFAVITANYAFNEAWYQQTAPTLPFPDKTSVEKADGVFSYIETGDARSLVGYTDRELTHLMDLRNLFVFLRNIFIILLGAWLGAIITTRSRAEIIPALEAINQGIRWFTILLLPVVSLVVINFEDFFLQFHYLAFRNTSWQLNPETETLIWTFPPEYFYHTAIQVGITTVTTCIFIAIVCHFAILYLNYKKQHEKN